MAYDIQTISTAKAFCKYVSIVFLGFACVMSLEQFNQRGTAGALGFSWSILRWFEISDYGIGYLIGELMAILSCLYASLYVKWATSEIKEKMLQHDLDEFVLNSYPVEISEISETKWYKVMCVLGWIWIWLSAFLENSRINQ